MILRVFFKLIPDIINKGLEVSKHFLEKYLEVGLCNRSGVPVATLVLGRSKIDCAIEIWDDKQITIHFSGARYYEIIPTLQIKSDSSLCEILQNKFLRL